MEPDIKRVLVPIDFSDYSKNSLKYAVNFVKYFGAELYLVYVIEPVIYPPDFSMGQIAIPSVDAEIDKRAFEELDTLAKSEIPPEVKCKCIIKTGKPFIEIIDTAKQEDIDLIIIASHGHTGVEHILFGSTAEKVVRKAPCPVLSFRDPKKGYEFKEELKKHNTE
jgi:nucleotide-binding universal stress UspA family protein